MAGTNNSWNSPDPTTDAQILIGSTAAPNIKLGTLTSPDSSVTIGYSSPNITLSVSGGGNLSVASQVFTTNGTYTPTAGMNYCIIEVVGAGGGGGSSVTFTGATRVSAGTGGGGGGYARGVFSAVTIGVSQAVTVGTGGAGGIVPGSGSAGGTSSVGALISSTGGTGGNPSIDTLGVPFADVGNGGVGSGGDFFTTGGCGGICNGLGSTNNRGAVGGAGGNSFFGGGAPNVITTGAATNTTGLPGTSYGGGGGGGAEDEDGIGADGGAGANGVVIVTEFI
jgi:hypothetical protein